MKSPPSNNAAERSVIGALLFGAEACRDDVIPLLTSEDFANPNHERIWAAISALHTHREQIDVVTVAAKLRELQTLRYLDSLGGEAYLVELVNDCASTEPAVGHAALIRELSLKRQLMLACADVLEQAYAERPYEAILAGVQAKIGSLAKRAGKKAPRPLGALLRETVANLEKRYAEKRALTGVPFGLSDLDALTGGAQPGDLVVIGGRPGMGKTSFVLGSALHAATQGHPGLIFSLEMGDSQITERTLSSHARVDSRALRTGLLTTTDWFRLTRSVADLVKLPILVDDEVSGLDTIAAKARAWRRSPEHFPTGKELGFVVLDYLQLVKSDRRSASREQEIAAISQGCKALAKELQVPVLTIASLSRKCEERPDKRPIMSDLRDSGQIESDADLVLFVYRDEAYDQASKDRGLAELIIAKQRNGTIGTCKVRFVAKNTSFEDLRLEKLEDL